MVKIASFNYIGQKLGIEKGLANESVDNKLTIETPVVMMVGLNSHSLL